MKLVTRAELGWPESPAAPQPTTLGVKIHYEGTTVSTGLLGNHELCVQEWRDIRASHLSNPTQGWVDVAYNFAVCPHGTVFEGRGLHKETGANGNQTLNHAHYAIVAMVGDKGLTSPTDDMLNGLRDAIEYMQANGAGPEIRGHRDGYSTDCPGEPLYAWVKAGAPRKGSGSTGGENGGNPPTSGNPPVPNFPAWPGRYIKLTATYLRGDDVRKWQQRMRDRGWQIVVDGVYGPASANVARQFQAEKHLAVDGIVGPATWAAAWTAPVTR